MARTKSEESARGGISRRDFARAATAAAALMAANPRAAVMAAPSLQAAEKTKLSADALAEVEAKFRVIIREYGSRLSEIQKADIHRILTEGMPGLERLRAYPMDNGTAPATPMRLFPPAEGIGARKGAGDSHAE
jgi:hypothetical protein